MTTAALPRRKSQRLWTFQEMVAESPETNLPVELWNGEIIMSPAPCPEHQEIVLNFARRLQDFASRGKLGKTFISPLDVVLSRRRVVQPDVFYVAKARLGIVKDYIDGVPDLAMEVISEGSWQRDRIEKKALYEQFGLKEYWIVDPDSRAIEVYILKKSGYQLHGKGTEREIVRSKLLAGFEIAFNDLVG